MLTFSEAEQNIKAYFNIGDVVSFKGENYNVINVGKPTSPHGEPKTDLYILLQNEKNNIEIKISYKKSNADFLENKIKAERAEQLFGSDWQKIIRDSTLSIKDMFLNKPLIYKNSLKRTRSGAITLGWKFELVNRKNGELSGEIKLSKEQYIDIYSGSNLSLEKRNANVNGTIITNSGIANYILFGNSFSSSGEILESIISINEYVKDSPQIYFACKALNFRTFENKYDGNRPLAVQVQWDINNNKLTPTLLFDNPLNWNGNSVYDRLKSCLNQLNIETTDDINEENTVNYCIHQ
ncbi:hypothetical protein SAMN05421675_0949 [Pasteurella multocida]|uniref:hypothetical protein n=1 Tax=Pasteurella multocida TaxID=747 RepID=UPI0008F03543|nr:hypothetical protein [Pasteurella multocida]SFO99399.1 hypothetical protein SAMN05421675_0949 [Pasteurella multocida]VEE38908.1 Uncharacterised protein [Pasteurella multocida subsp. gallicida]HDR1923869.1 hypothetical protein [Pasteurella multocida]